MCITPNKVTFLFFIHINECMKNEKGINLIRLRLLLCQHISMNKSIINLKLILKSKLFFIYLEKFRTLFFFFVIQIFHKKTFNCFIL